MSWLLLTLVTASTLVAPLTQHLWAWDHFLHGGQDFETACFLILVSFCLAIVLTRACKACLEQILAALRAFPLWDISGPRPARFVLSLQLFLPAVQAPSGAACRLPLRI